jgi:hypothetical protein
MKYVAAMFALVVLAACGSSGGGGPIVTPTATPTGVPTATPTPAQRLYAAGDGVPSNAIAYFTAPFSNTATPTGTIATGVGGEIAGVLVDANRNLVASDQNLNTLTGYTRPAPTSTTEFTNSPGFTPAGIAYDNAGTFYVSNYSGGAVEVGPLHTALAGGTLFSVLVSVAAADGICFDSSENLYVTSYLAGKIYVYSAPYTGTPTVVQAPGFNTDDCAYDSVTNQLAIVQLSGPAEVLVYNLPLNSASTPATTLTPAGTTASAVTVDKAGNLYVATDNPSINIYAPPFTGAAIFAFPDANGAVQSMTFGT